MSISQSCIKHVYINAVEYSGTITKIIINETLEGSTCKLYAEQTYSTPLTITPKSTVTIVSDLDEIIFFGIVRIPPTPEYDGGILKYEILVDDIVKAYNHIPVQQSLTDMTIKDIFTYFIGYYTADTLGTVAEVADRVTMDFKGGLSDCIKKLVELATDVYVWKVELIGGVVYHSLVAPFTAYNTDIIEVSEQGCKPFVANLSGVYNIIQITATGVKWPDKAYQNWLFVFDSTIDPPDGYDQDMFGIPLAAKPENLQVFLLLGTYTGVESVYRAETMELQVVKRESGEPLNLDISKYIHPVTRVKPDQLSGDLSYQSMFMGPSIESPSVPSSGSLLIGYFDRALTCKYDPQMIENHHQETSNGVVYVFTFDYLKKYLPEVMKRAGKKYEATKIMGYRIVYDKVADYTETFENAASRVLYGDMLAEPITIKVPDIKWFKAYGDRKIASLSEVPVTGQATTMIASRGTRLYSDVPRAGNKINITLGPWGQYNDVLIQTVEHQIDGASWICTVSAEKSKTKSLLDAYFKKLQSELDTIMNPAVIENHTENQSFTTSLGMSESISAAEVTTTWDSELTTIVLE